MIALGVNKQKLKAHLMKDGKTIVPLKLLHNIQTKQRLSKEAGTKETELKELLDELNKIPHFTVRVFTNGENELIGNL